MLRVEGECASIEMRSLPGAALTRSFQSLVKYARHCPSTAIFFSLESIGPPALTSVVATSDQ